MWHIDTEDNGNYVDWRATFNASSQTTVGNEYYLNSGEGLVSALEPVTGDIFRTLSTYKPAVGAITEPFVTSYFSTDELDATSNLNLGFQDISSDDVLVFNLTAKDLAGNSRALYSCSGPPNQFLLYIYAYEASTGWDGGDATEDLPDFSVQIIHNGAVIRDTPAVQNQGSMVAILTLPYASGTLELKIHDEDEGSEEQLTHWDGMHALLQFTLSNNNVGTHSYLDGNPTKNAKVFIRAIHCAEH
jgi:hypothetical protein